MFQLLLYLFCPSPLTAETQQSGIVKMNIFYELFLDAWQVGQESTPTGSDQPIYHRSSESEMRKYAIFYSDF